MSGADLGYPDTQLLLNGLWRDGADGKTIPVVDPATGACIGKVAQASIADLNTALASAAEGFELWSSTSAFERSQLMRRAADILRGRADAIAYILTREQGKPLAEARGEVLAASDVIEWFAEEARRTYGQIIPSRAPGGMQTRSSCRLAPSLPSPRGIFRLTRWCASWPERWLRAAPSS